MDLLVSQYPDEVSCSPPPPTIQPIPPVQFTLPPGPLVVDEGEAVSVCVRKEGETEQTLSVRITTISIDDGIAAIRELSKLYFLKTQNVLSYIAVVDYQMLDDVLEFRPGDFVMCVSINTTTDSTFEGLEPFAVFLEFFSQTIGFVRVDIIDGKNTINFLGIVIQIIFFRLSR